MTRLNQRRLTLVAMAIIMFSGTLLAGCQPAVQKKEAPAEPLVINRVLILPFKNVSAVYGVGEMVRCKLCGDVFPTGPVQEDADVVLTELLVAMFEQEGGYEIIRPMQAQGARAEIIADGGDRLNPREFIVELGRRTDADAVLSGHVYRYIERVGGDYSVDSPASVLFDLDLVRTSDGRVVWRGNFNETQQNLFSNVLKLGQFLERNGTWLSAKDLAHYGMKDLLKRFPKP